MPRAGVGKAQGRDAMNEPQPQYVGFWARVGAAIIDSILMAIVLVPVGRMVYGGAHWSDIARLDSPANIMVNGVLPAIAVILFWVYRQATPGKMAIGAKIVDAKTLGKPSTGQLIGRYFSYYLSSIVLLLGFIWVGIDARKQGWHDKLAGTLVVRSR
jgi:uncharacterized RDD family membrane protein YckC